MKLAVYGLNNEKVREINLPKQFNETARVDLVRRAVLAIQSHKRQPYGAKPEAGKRASAVLSRRRHDYKGSYGLGISRVPRKTMSRRGTRMFWVGAFAPGTVGGRRAHPPKAGKIYWQEINKKERRKAIRSALAATIINDLVKGRGHILPKNYPFALDNTFESLDKTKKAKEALENIGLKDELIRSSKKTIRAGKGKTRGRKYIKRKGPLIVVADECKLLMSANNIAGIDVVKVNELNTELLAPGSDIGRLTLFTQKAIERLEKEKLFM